MTENNDKKNPVHFLSDKKKQLILNLDIINNKLDTFRTNINIVRYNLLENDRIKDSQLPNFDFEKANEIINLFGNLLNGTIKDYSDVLQKILSVKSSAEELASDQKGESK